MTIGKRQVASKVVAALAVILALEVISNGESVAQDSIEPKPMTHVMVKGGSFQGIRFSADGSRIWTNRLESWSVENGKKLDSISLDAKKRSVSFDLSPNGKRMLIVRRGSVAFKDLGSKLQERELKSGKAVNRLRLTGMGDRFIALIRSPATAITGSVESAKEDKSIPLPTEFYRADVSASGRTVALASSGDVTVWDMQKRKSIQLFSQDKRIFSIAISPDEQLVATGGNDNLVRLFDTKTGKLTATMKGHGSGSIFLPSAVYSLAFSPDGKWLASGGHDGRVIVWNVKTKQAQLTAEVKSQPIVWSVTFSPDSTLVAGGYEAASAKHGLGIWKVKK